MLKCAARSNRGFTAWEFLRTALDLVIYSYQNSHRADLQVPAEYAAYSGGTWAFSPREREPMLWDNWTMKADLQHTRSLRSVFA